MSRKRICLIAYKPVRRTIHALRLINYLSPLYDLTVIGHGEPDPEWPNLTWHAVPKQDRRSQLIKLGWYLLGRVSPVFYEFWYWGIARHRRAYEYAVASGADAFHAHDWEALPIAIAAARRTGGRVVFDMREYTEEEGGDRFLWRFLVGPAMHHFIRKYAAYPNVPIAGSITVCEPIAERYREELGLQPVVVFNAPRPVAVPPRSNDHDDTGDVSIRLIHHGLAQRGRGLEKLIEALVLMDRRFTLDFMLVDDSPGHLDELKELAARAAPDRVHFRDPVHPSEIVRTIAQYDLGFCVIAPASYNQLMMMPNKLFEFIQAGLAVCVGPSPAMAALVRQHGVGWVTPSFSPSDIAATLNRLTIPELRTMQQASRRAATVLNADVEMDKIVVMYRQLFSAESGPLPATTSPRGAGSSSRPIETGEQASAPRAIGGT